MEGINISSEPLQRVITADMQQRAADLEAQNAEPYEVSRNFGKKSKSKGQTINISLGNLAEAGELALDIAEEGNDVIENPEDQVAPAETFSDVNDSEIDQYIATPEEAEIKKMIWLQSNKEWLEAQEARAAAARQLEAVPKKKYKKRKPVIEFKKGATARESVVNMLESKNLMGSVNNEAVDKFFTDAERLCTEDTSEPPVQEPPKESAMATAIKGEQNSLHNKKNAQAQKHQAALLKEQASQGASGWLNLGLSAAAKRSKRPIRLGKL